MPHVFISYKHGDTWTRIVKRLEMKLRTVAPALKFELFCDNEIDPGRVWRDEVRGALEKTTHFIALLCDEYWMSPECQKELQYALGRFQASGHRTPKLLFILGERMQPGLLRFVGGGHAGVVVNSVGDINFLGPYDEGRRLVRLEWNDLEKQGDQIAALTEALGRLIARDVTALP